MHKRYPSVTLICPVFSTQKGLHSSLKEMHNHFSKIAYSGPDFIIPHSRAPNMNEALFIVLSKRFPRSANPISIHVSGRTKIHLTVLRHRATTLMHQVVLITTIMRAACRSGFHPRSSGNPSRTDDVAPLPSGSTKFLHFV